MLYVQINHLIHLFIAALDHGVTVQLRIREIYGLENVMFCIAVYGAYKPQISRIRDTECSNATEINSAVIRFTS